MTNQTLTSISGIGSDDGGEFIVEGTLFKSGYHEIKKKYNDGNLILLRGKTLKKGEEIKEFHGIWELKDIDCGDYKYSKY